MPGRTGSERTESLSVSNVSVSDGAVGRVKGAGPEADMLAVAGAEDSRCIILRRV
jgi:hypothetical protein